MTRATFTQVTLPDFFKVMLKQNFTPIIFDWNVSLFLYILELDRVHAVDVLGPQVTKSY